MAKHSGFAGFDITLQKEAKGHMTFTFCPLKDNSQNTIDYGAVL